MCADVTIGPRPHRTYDPGALRRAEATRRVRRTYNPGALGLSPDRRPTGHIPLLGRTYDPGALGLSRSGRTRFCAVPEVAPMAPVRWGCHHRGGPCPGATDHDRTYDPGALGLSPTLPNAPSSSIAHKSHLRPPVRWGCHVPRRHAAGPHRLVAPTTPVRWGCHWHVRNVLIALLQVAPMTPGALGLSRGSATRPPRNREPVAPTTPVRWGCHLCDDMDDFRRKFASHLRPRRAGVVTREHLAPPTPNEWSHLRPRCAGVVTRRPFRLHWPALLPIGARPVRNPAGLDASASLPDPKTAGQPYYECSWVAPVR